MPKIATILSHAGHDQRSIALLLSRDALYLDPDGIPSPGIELSPLQARALAGRLSMLATQADENETPEAVGKPSAILVVHDGTPRGDRAFALALTMARDSDAVLYLQVRDQVSGDQPGDIVEQCARQLGVLQSVAARCAAEAARHSVRLKPCAMTFGEHGGGIVPPDADIDFLILPTGQTASPADIGRYVVLVR